MRCLKCLAVLLTFLLALPAWGEEKPKRLLLVTLSGGFMHDSVLVAENTLKEVGPRYGFETTCYRFTGDPDAKLKRKKQVDGKEVEYETLALAGYSEDFRARTGEKGKPGEEVTKAHCGRVNAETLKQFDVVLFFTTGNPVTKDELKQLIDWVKAGGAFAGAHCGADTLYDTAYGEFLGAYFKIHPPGFQKVKLRVEDPKHAAAKGFTDGTAYEDEMYIFRDEPYSRERLHVILSIDPETFKPKDDQARKDADYAVSWCREEGAGRVFYTSLGHRREVWRDPRFQEHLFGGLKWALKQAPGDATPSAKLPR
jgi:type 1 glutamine amidotransferase